MAKSDPLVSLAGVSYRYPGASENALRSVSIEFHQGEVTLLTGALGAGCSTLMLVAAGLVPRVMGGKLIGKAVVLGNDPHHEKTGASLAGRVGLLLPTPWTQVSGMAFTVQDEIAFGPSNLGWSRESISERVQDVMERLKIEHLADRDPTQLSGGELQKVMMASVTVMEPDLLLLDEPAVELDPPSARSLYDMLPELAAEKAVVIASTDVDRIHSNVDRIVVMAEGQVVADGPTDEILRKTELSNITTSVGRVFKAAGVVPFPINIDEAVQRFGH
jgi:energy-coupling factor transporter ATP-binding protein EcfA2